MKNQYEDFEDETECQLKYLCKDCETEFWIDEGDVVSCPGCENDDERKILDLQEERINNEH